MLLNKEITVCTIIIFVITTSVSSWVVDDQGCRTPEGGTGICVLAKLCGPIINFLSSAPRPLPPYVQEKFKSYLCGYEDGGPKVCCPPTPILLVPQNKTTTEQTMRETSKPNVNQMNVMMKTPDELRLPNSLNTIGDDEERDIMSHINFHLLSQDCGFVGSINKISQGKNTSLGEFPWMALLSYRINNRIEFKCGGTIINDRYILTAAHCLNGPLVKVRVGEYDVSKEIDCQLQEGNFEKCSPPVQNLRIEETIPHPKFTMDFNNEDGVNDIALLRVSPIKMNSYVKPVCLPNGEIPKRTPNRLIISGWGLTEKSSKMTPILQKASLKTLAMNKCQEFYQGRRVRITAKLMCANKGNTGSCMGDSGGPLQNENYIYDDVRSVQYGIVSFGGANCGSGVNPGIYTRVSSYMNWILDNIRP